MIERNITGVEYTITVNNQDYKTILDQPLPEQIKNMVRDIEDFTNAAILNSLDDRANILFKLYYIIKDNNLSKKEVLQTINTIYREYCDNDVENF